MPFEAIHSRRFGDLVTVYQGHEVADDGLEGWARPDVELKPWRVETEDGASWFTVADAGILADQLAAAHRFAAALYVTPHDV